MRDHEFSIQFLLSMVIVVLLAKNSVKTPTSATLLKPSAMFMIISAKTLANQNADMTFHHN